ncbi:hypothetical protein VTL71DRAFT_779 [Oculimacula yallundae]|uniref:Uncharacterized protein n=1 Tax=Oculimacula yallundae TaxID=86028 RepID=A0ABR4D112_9HELO
MADAANPAMQFQVPDFTNKIGDFHVNPAIVFQLQSLFVSSGSVHLSATRQSARYFGIADERSSPEQRRPKEPPGSSVLPQASSASNPPLSLFPSSTLRLVRSIIFRTSSQVLRIELADVTSLSQGIRSRNGTKELSDLSLTVSLTTSNAIKPNFFLALVPDLRYFL